MATSGKANRLGFFLLMPKGSKKAIDKAMDAVRALAGISGVGKKKK